MLQLIHKNSSHFLRVKYITVRLWLLLLQKERRYIHIHINWSTLTSHFNLLKIFKRSSTLHNSFKVRRSMKKLLYCMYASFLWIFVEGRIDILLSLAYQWCFNWIWGNHWCWRFFSKRYCISCFYYQCFCSNRESNNNVSCK